MEPKEYLSIMRRRWRLVGGCFVAALVVAWLMFTNPTGPKKPTFQASTILVKAAQPTGETLRQGPLAVPWDRVPLIVRSGEVPRRVARRLAFPGALPQLTRRIQVKVDRKAGTITLTAATRGRDDALRIADGFREEFLAFVAEGVTAERLADLAKVTEKIAEKTARVQQLQAGVAADPQNKTAQAELGALQPELIALFGRKNDLEDPTPPEWETLEPATAAAISGGGGGLAPPPGRRFRFSAAAFLGLLVGGGLAVLVDRVDPRLRTRAAAEQALGLPVVAEIPAQRTRRRGGRSYEVVTLTKPRSPAAESYRMLRGAIIVWARPQRSYAETVLDPTPTEAVEPRVLLVTSPTSRGGRTVTVANLAACFAEAGQSVLVVSCDFRHSDVHRYLQAAEVPGLSDVAAKADGSLAAVVQPTNIAAVRVVSSGKPVENPAQLLPAVRGMLRAARAMSDVVIVDAAPVLMANDVADLINEVDAVVVVCRVGHTTADEAARTNVVLSRIGAPVAAVALIGTPPHPALRGYASSWLHLRLPWRRPQSLATTSPEA